MASATGPRSSWSKMKLPGGFFNNTNKCNSTESRQAYLRHSLGLITEGDETRNSGRRGVGCHRLFHGLPASHLVLGWAGPLCLARLSGPASIGLQHWASGQSCCKHALLSSCPCLHGLSALSSPAYPLILPQAPLCRLTAAPEALLSLLCAVSTQALDRFKTAKALCHTP